MASAPQTYKKGTQDIAMNQDTFGWFWFWTKTGLIFIALLLILMVYLFT
jgi:hypothetical protein